MTREEAKTYLENYRKMYADIAPERFLEALDCILSQSPISSNLDEAAEEYAYSNWESDDYHEGASEGFPFDAIGYTAKCFKAGAEWRENQMKMPSSSELIAAWGEAKSVLQEKDFRNDQWRLAYNAFMFGFAKGLNTKREK